MVCQFLVSAGARNTDSRNGVRPPSSSRLSIADCAEVSGISRGMICGCSPWNAEMTMGGAAGIRPHRVAYLMILLTIMVGWTMLWALSDPATLTVTVWLCVPALAVTCGTLPRKPSDTSRSVSVEDELLV